MKTGYPLEEVLERASQGLRRKIEYSVNLLRKAERLALAYDKDNGFYLAFSGGKDSQALYHIAELAGVRFKAHMNLTSIDPPEVIRFVKQNYSEVELIAPKKSIYALAVEKQILPTMRVRWCCAEYKEGAGAGKVTLIGIRHEESSRRAKRNEIEISSRKYSGTLEGLDEYREEQRKKKNAKGTNITNATEESTAGCIHGKESLLVSPIIHWTERDVWEFLNDVVRVEHCCLYDEGYKRIGCILCPMSQPKQKAKEMLRWPHVKRKWIEAIKAIRLGGYSKKNIYGGTCRTRELPPPQCTQKFLSEGRLDADSPYPPPYNQKSMEKSRKSEETYSRENSSIPRGSDTTETGYYGTKNPQYIIGRETMRHFFRVAHPKR